MMVTSEADRIKDLLFKRTSEEFSRYLFASNSKDYSRHDADRQHSRYCVLVDLVECLELEEELEDWEDRQPMKKYAVEYVNGSKELIESRTDSGAFYQAADREGQENIRAMFVIYEPDETVRQIF